MQAERLSFEAEEPPKELHETTADQLVQQAEITALNGLANYVTPFGVELAEKVTPTDDEHEILTSFTSADKHTHTKTHRSTASLAVKDSAKDGDLDR